MTFMRSNTVLNKRITKADYKKLRETLDLINILISKYSNTYPSRYHLNNFKEFFNGFISFVKKTDETKINNFLAENEEIQNFQLSLSKTMIWALLKSIPRVSKIPLVGFLLKNLLIKIVESYNFRSKVMINETINWIFLTVNENSKKMTIKLR